MNFSDDITFAETLNRFNITTSILISIIGVACNTITFFIFTSKSFRDQSMNRWLAALAITDTIVVLFVWPQNLPNIYAATTFNCQMIQFAIIFTYTMCSFLITITSIDRMLAVVYPTKFAFRKKLWCQALVLLITCILTAIFNSPYFIYFGAVQESNVTSCHYTTPFVNIYVDIFLLIIYLVMPVVIILICTIAIYHKLHSLKLKSGRLTNSNKDTYLTKTIFGTTLFYFVMNAPVDIAVIFTDYNLYYYRNVNLNVFIYNFLNFVSLLHNSCSFFVYLLCNKMFRMKFLSILSIIYHKNKIAPSNLSNARVTTPH